MLGQPASYKGMQLRVMLDLLPLVAAASSAHTALSFGFQRIVYTVHTVYLKFVRYGIRASPQSLSYFSYTTASGLQDANLASLGILKANKLPLFLHTTSVATGVLVVS